MEDYPVIDKTFLCGIKDDKKTIEESPLCFHCEVKPEQKDAFLECLGKVKLSDFTNMCFAALGLYLTNLYSDQYITE